MSTPTSDVYNNKGGVGVEKLVLQLLEALMVSLLLSQSSNCLLIGDTYTKIKFSSSSALFKGDNPLYIGLLIS